MPKVLLSHRWLRGPRGTPDTFGKILYWKKQQPTEARSNHLCLGDSTVADAVRVRQWIFPPIRGPGRTVVLVPIKGTVQRVVKWDCQRVEEVLRLRLVALVAGIATGAEWDHPVPCSRHRS